MGQQRTAGVTERAPIRVAASFTAAPILSRAAHIGRLLDWPAELTETPYGRFAVHLADPEGAFWAKASGRAIFWRPEDLGGDLAEAVRTLSTAIRNFHDGGPLLIVTGAATDIEEEAATDALSRALGPVPGLEVACAYEAGRAYGLADMRDSLTDEAGHIPYTEDGMAALGQAFARWGDGLLRSPVKLIAVDADNTLWQGVLGEDEATGLALPEGYADLQRRLKAAAEAGVILALLTKNDDADIREVFEQRTDFPLSTDDFLAIRAGWDDKAGQLRQLLDDYGLGENAAFFLDDNPVECAMMRGALPEVVTVRLPEEGPQAAFLDHLWPLDRREVTKDDLARLDRYRQEEERVGEKRRARSLDEFFASLDLQVELFTPDAETIPRLAQLSQRTNQFSTTLRRLSEADLRTALDAPHGFVRGVKVADRFGDYGVVGLLFGERHEQELSLDLWSLSCRVLGRGVEEEILRRLPEEAGAESVAFAHVMGPRNQPARDSLARLSGYPLQEQGEINVSAQRLSQMVFEPGEAARQAPADQGHASEGFPDSEESRGEVYERIALSGLEPSTLAHLFKTIRGRPDLDTAFEAPQGATERAVAGIWSDVLGVEGIGRRDDFHALGGRSLDLVRIHARLVRDLDAKMTLADLFRFPTIADLSAFLDGTTRKTGDRAAAMRAARTRRQRPARSVS